MNIDIFNKSENDQLKILKIVNIFPLTYRLLYHYLCFVFIIMKNCKLELNELIEKQISKRELRSAFSLPKINKDIKLYSLVITVLKTLNLLKKSNNLIINECKKNEFKNHMKRNIENIYEASCFKMDPVYVLEFDKKKYYEDINKKKEIQIISNNSND
jgi:hypothetical protein